MDLDTLRYLLLLRPFIVFLAAAPLLALAALVGWYQERRRERSARHAYKTEAVGVSQAAEAACQLVLSSRLLRGPQSAKAHRERERVIAGGSARALASKGTATGICVESSLIPGAGCVRVQQVMVDSAHELRTVGTIVVRRST